MLTAIEALASSFNIRFDAVDKRLDGMNERFDGIDERLDRIEEVLTEVKGTSEFLAEWADVVGPAIGVSLASVAVAAESADT